MEPNTIFYIVYFVSMVLTFTMLCYMGMNNQGLLTNGDMFQIIFVSLAPVVNTVFAFILAIVLFAIGDTPLHRWMNKPAFISKKREDY